ncbi:LCP family protein [Catenulispora sp. NL8]|uniref:LCP family protein n=1 Tax=Catenulispora pinistramenti TaxID=2705254 RepID=A0ABS5KLX2_9ACTN|nr:LCP family protein [Catenulispora pinistramenti]MBS2547053.1 LCP family protein [Catenulispora pinistramenti]
MAENENTDGLDDLQNADGAPDPETVESGETAESSGSTESAEPAAQPGRAAEKSGTAARRTSPAVIAARGVFAVAGAAVLAGSGIAWYGVHKLDTGVQSVDTSKVEVAHGKPAPVHSGLDKSVNILLIGLDSRYAMNGDALPDDVVHDELHAGSASDLLGGENANSEIILHVPAGNGTPTAVSIPRDDWVDAQDGYGNSMGTMKVKEAYGNAYYYATQKASASGTSDTHALAKIGHAAGVKAQIATLETLLNIPIDHFAEVNLMGFYDVAGDVGPVQVCLKRPTQDENSGANFPAGVFTLDTPTKALAFVREREDLPNGDLDRTHRQQAYITAVLKRLKDQGFLSDLSKMDSLIGTAEKDVIIDSGWNLLDFAGNASALSDGSTSFRTAPIITDSSWKWIGKNHEVGNEIDIPTVQAFVKSAFADSDATSSTATTPTTPTSTDSTPTPAPTSSSSAQHVTGTAVVENASGVNGAAAKEVSALSALGLTASVGDNIRPSHQKTTVLYGSGASAAAQAVGTQLGGVTATADSTVKAGSILVVIGTDKGDSIAAGNLSSTPSTPGSTAGSSTAGSSTSGSSTPSGSSTATSSGNGENGGTITGNGPDSVNGIPCIN